MSDPSAPTIVIYGADWCPDCRRAKKFLGEQRMPYVWIDIDKNKPAQELVESLNDGNRSIPTILFDFGQRLDPDTLPGNPSGEAGQQPEIDPEDVLVEPSNAELARKLGLTTEAKCAAYDLVVVGGGPAGLTAALYAAREGLEVLLVERSALGGQAAITDEIENFPGFPTGISGGELAGRFAEQARRWEVEILQAQEVSSIEPGEPRANYHDVHLASGQLVRGRAVLLATGATYRRLGVPGEEELIGKSVHFCATCDGPFYRGAEKLAVIGGGNSATEEALHLTRYADEVMLLVRGPELTASKAAIEKVTRHPQIDLRFETSVTALGGERKLDTIQVETASGEETLTADGIFVFIGMTPNSELLEGVVAEDKRGFILTGHDLAHHDEVPDPLARAYETNVPGIFAAGDVRRGATAQIASAVGEGAAAALAVRDHLRQSG